MKVIYKKIKKYFIRLYINYNFLFKQIINLKLRYKLNLLNY